MNLEKLSQQEIENFKINPFQEGQDEITGWDLTRTMKPRSQSSVRKIKTRRADSCRSA